MRNLEIDVTLERILELSPSGMGEFCANALDAETLLQEFELGPFVRRSFCEFVGVGESTLTGWLKADRIPQSAKAAYVLLVSMTVLQDEIRRLQTDAEDFKIIRDGETYQVVRFKADNAGIAVGKVVARDIADAKTARALASTRKAFRLLNEDTQGLIEEMFERTEDPGLHEYLERLKHRIIETGLAVVDPEKYREYRELRRVPNPDNLEEWLTNRRMEKEQRDVLLDAVREVVAEPSSDPEAGEA